MFRSPISRCVSSPLNFRSCGIRPIDANGKISVSSPISVNPSTTADAPMRHRRPSFTCSPITAFGPTIVPAPISAPFMTTAVGWMRDAIGHDGEQQVGFGDDLIADVARRARLGQRRARPAQRHLEPQPVARNDLPPELRVVHAVQIHARHRHRALRARAAAPRPPASASRASARPASAARPESGPGRSLR